MKNRGFTQHICNILLFLKFISFDLLYFIKNNRFSTYISCFLDIFKSYYDKYHDYYYIYSLESKAIYPTNLALFEQNPSLKYYTNQVLGLISTFFLAIRNYFTNKSDLKSPNILKNFVFANLYYGSSLDKKCENGMSEDLLQRIYVKV